MISLPFTTAYEYRRAARAGGNALCGTDKLFVQLGDNQSDSLCCARRVGNEFLRCCACAAKVALAVRSVQNHLVAGVGVNGGHDTALYGSVVVKRFRHGCKAVCRAAGCGDDGIACFEDTFVYAVNDGGKGRCPRERKITTFLAPASM